VGILKDWLVRALARSMEIGERSLTLRSLEETALSIWQCEQIARETLAGEERLEEKPESMSRLREMLGLVTERMTAPMIEERPQIEGDENGKNPIAEKAGRKGRIGRRKPKRDPLTRRKM
jgi:hypothetical protein